MERSLVRPSPIRDSNCGAGQSRVLLRGTYAKLEKGSESRKSIGKDTDFLFSLCPIEPQRLPF